MGLHDRLSKVMQLLENARSKGRELRDDEMAEPGASLAAWRASHREARRGEGMAAEDREPASQQRDRERRTHSGEPTSSSDEPTIAEDP